MNDFKCPVCRIWSPSHCSTYVCDFCYNSYLGIRTQERLRKHTLRDIRALRWEQFDLMQYADDDCIHISEFVDTVFCKKPTLRQGRLVQGHSLWDTHNE
jgi:hypothetical protein